MRMRLLSALLVLLPVAAGAQPTQKLYSLNASGTITANGGSVEVLNTGGLAGGKVQSTGTYTGTWELQCSSAPAGQTPVYDTDDELNMTLEGASAAAVQDVTSTVGIWNFSATGCTAVKAIATSAMTGTLTIYIYLTSTGGGSGGGGGVLGSVTADTELPAAAALADATANPTTAAAGSMMHGYNGATWDRLRSDTTNGLDVDVTRMPADATELPAVETPADDLTNATNAPRVLALMMCFDGSTWDRCQSTRDPCDGAAKTVIPINISTATTTELTPSLAGANNYYYVCSINIGPVQAAQNIAIVDDDSDGCGSLTAGMAGGTTAGSGWNIAANGGLVLGNGTGTVMKTNGTNRVVCAITSAATQTPGVMTVVAAP